MSVLSTAQLASIRSTLGVLLAHTYTRTPVSQGTEDAWGDTADTAGAAVTGLPCLYQATQTLRQADGSRVTVETPSLRVAIDDPLAVGDRVSAIEDQDGTPLASGPFVVETIEPRAGLGADLQHHAILRYAAVAE